MQYRCIKTLSIYFTKNKIYQITDMGQSQILHIVKYDNSTSNSVDRYWWNREMHNYLELFSMSKNIKIL